MNLIAIPFHDWHKCEIEGFRTRDAHLILEFGKHPLIEKLVVINRPISLTELVLRRKRIKQYRSTVRQVREKTYTIDIVLPDILGPILRRRNWIPEAYGRTKTASTVRSGLNKLGIHRYSIFTNEPIHVPLIQQLTPQVFAFDMTDNLLKHASYRNMPRLKEYYDYCINNATVITANSPENTKWLEQRQANVLYIPNGVDTTRFNPENSYSIPDDMHEFPRPIVGFAGKMQEMIDIDLMLKLVKATPKTHYVFIGQQLDKHHMAPLWRCATVHYLGDKHYDELPNYLAAFDICIIPYHTDRQHGVDPIKFYEYMAMNKPIVTTNVGGVSAFRSYPQVKIAGTTEDFIMGVKLFVDKIKSGAHLPKVRLPSECFWSTKADSILRLIHSRL